jgi:hypothetical protein
MAVIKSFSLVLNHKGVNLMEFDLIKLSIFFDVEE